MAPMARARILVRSASDVGSAVALRLRQAGHAVALHDDPRPPHPRRGMAFTDAWFEGACRLDGVQARLAPSSADLAALLEGGEALPATDAPFAEVLAALAPEVVVDARIHKHAASSPLRGLARVTVALGPGFVAGRDADLVVETAWGEDLGRVMREGAARAYAGEPRPLDGHGRDRYVYAGAAGLFRTRLAIGDAVRAGDLVASIGGTRLPAPLDGILRGLTHDGAEVRAGAKVVEVDPRGDPAAAFGVGERPGRIAAGVVAAVAEALGGR
jgi:xanthine dehydrogenase accessory factor